MAPFLGEVVATVQAPDIVTAHERYRDRAYFYRDWSDRPGFPCRWLKAVVRFGVEPEPGRLLSAWPTRDIEGGEVLWVQMKL